MLLAMQVSLCALWGAGFQESLVPRDDRHGSLEERRAEAMGKRLDRFETMAGRVYRDVRITKISDGGISFSHEDGAARLRFGDLNPEQRRYFGINGEDAAAVYAREMRAREAYERQVEAKEEARRELAAKEAAARAELERLAMERAEKQRAAAAEKAATRTIPLYPTIKRVDSRPRYSRQRFSYGSYYGGFGYRHPNRYSRPVYRSTGCAPVYRSGIHFTIR